MELEKHFEVTSKEFVSMDPRFELVIIDIPGLDDAQESQTYYEYVKRNFGNFDFLMVVVDVNRGFETKEQMNLLDLVEHGIQKVRKIPFCFVVNKVDHTDEENETIMVDAIKGLVAKKLGKDTSIVSVSSLYSYIYSNLLEILKSSKNKSKLDEFLKDASHVEKVYGYGRVFFFFLFFVRV